MNSALLILDLINDIVCTQGKTPSCAAQVLEKQVIEKTNLAMAFAREQDWPVILVKVGFSKFYPEQPKNSPIFGKADTLEALQLGQWGTAFHSDLLVNERDYVLVKHRVSPFYGTALDLVLRNKEISRLIVCGVSSTWAVQAAARDGHDRDFELVIIEDACAAATAEEHQLSMRQLSRIATIITTGELDTLVSPSPAGGRRCPKGG